MRFTRTEEAGDPCAILFVVRRVVICVKEFGQIAANLLRKHILVDLIIKVLLIIGLDHTIDVAVNVLAEQLLETDAVSPVHLCPFFFERILANPASCHVAADRTFL